jgi:hypothetical protein
VKFLKTITFTNSHGGDLVALKLDRQGRYHPNDERRHSDIKFSQLTLRTG